MLTLKLGTQQITLTQRDAMRLIEGMMLAIKDPAGAGRNALHLGDLTLSSQPQSVKQPVNYSSGAKDTLTNC
ncbi:hypothetical protein GRAQ_00299 [Rahnella aquatilis CIP 78.65 = ATCC 33071]|uniref:Uncharacterized protein n=1 Tax=Rahnella aquatilis (strain ATCC 33071 / DSM 4594 / JCM 1683 / NBRC 105701 / NCIMB 13365 / CIP 78.65) TaxID=745277 RepID=H2J0Q4_RAHAC|nr:hypothetical protein [Rahnella aquatilis]AEX51146.1 hypothetical protein Rahaq2_1263 [Rahnella aquatilis CIP 78.65 = ATCC 33071]KFD17973.1 hypothetical protein GRAQ_00299 [Rahnella aquatilis CIP 78.65 = ATCC 33071]